MADADDLFNPTQSIWKVTRQLKKEQSSLYNCIASVLSDAAFVSEVRSLYPTLPLLANLRCGLWYTRQADGTCYFKSTDGHNGNWSFSSTRLNWHVCELAAQQGGVIIVDATRKGKRFPDAMTKTIPVWAAVVNRAVARKRAEAAARVAAAAATATVAAATEAAEAALQQEPQNELATACSADRTSDPAPPGMPIPASLLRVVQRDRTSSGGDDSSSGSVVTSPPPPHGAWAAWAATEGDATGSSGSCARVGSLSQWLQSPMAMAARADDPEASFQGPGPRPLPTLHCLLHDDRGADATVAATLAGDAAALPAAAGCGVPAEEAGCGDTTASGPANNSGTKPYGMYSVKLREEVSFGEPDERAPGGGGQQQQQQQPQQPLRVAVDTPCGDRPSAAAATLEDTSDDSCLYSAAASVPAVVVAASLCLSPFAVAATAAAVAGHTDSAPAPAAAATADSIGSVDLGAASASHMSCSPEESCRWGGLFGDVVDTIDCNTNEDLLRLCCACNCSCSGRDGAVQHRLQGQRQQQQDSDPEADGSGGSCSDTCGPAGLSGLASTRTSSSSFSSLCISRSSSFSSDHSDRGRRNGAAAVRALACGGGCSSSRACAASDTGPRLRPFPRHHSCSTSAPPPWSPSKSRRCGSASQRAATAASGGNSRFSSGGSSSSGGGSSCSNGSSATGAAAVDPAAALPPGVSGSDRCAGVSCACADGGECWDLGLHLPLWISSNERAQIERRLDGWVDALLRVGADVKGLAKVLTKPLRPLWISQSSTIWVDQVAQPDQLPFTPLYLVSASQPHSYTRQAACVGGGGSASSDADADADNDGDSSGDRSGGGSAAPARRISLQKQRRHSQEQQQQQQPHAWTYVYVPGAGDDEESWAAGLTPAVFWAHYTELLQAGPAGVYDAVRQVLQREAAALAECGTNSSILAAAVTNGSAAASAYAAPTDKHHLMPSGCRGGGGAAAAAAPAPGGLFFIGPTGIALGDLAAGTAPSCWSQVDAVLSCGMHQHPSMAGEPQWPHGEPQLPPDPAAAAGSVAADGALGPEARAGLRQERCEAAGGFSFQPILCSDSGEATAIGDGDGSCDGRRRPAEAGVEDSGEQQQELGERGHHHHHHRQRHHHLHQQQQQRAVALRYLHLPVQHYKHHRTSLLQHLDTALEFLSYHLSRGHRVLIHDTNGLDTCVCVAVALLLACYGPGGGGGGGGRGGGREVSVLVWARPYRAGSNGTAAELPPEAVSKDAVRQRLAHISALYPPARPTRGMLRQVFNHFVNSKGAVAAVGGEGEEAE